ncbi:MAG: GAF domain-containing sensor histidine kinase [Coleofasciculus sp. B1-GNL1-01]|uniref:GAF domain-containing sensor histidine kinase n=1 Tax=Coleofasciculus sp. B1-GNL1-01 TaxID=3068484 RepID=UPI0032F2A304
MFIPASSEFVALCQSQVGILTQSLGAALSAVYLTTDKLDEAAQPKLIPVVVYPEAAIWEEEDTELTLPDRMSSVDTIPRLAEAVPRLLPQPADDHHLPDSTSLSQDNYPLSQGRQMVLPLIHEEVVMGLLVTSRDDRPWNEKEQTAIERIAGTLTLAYLMDRRRAWFEQEWTQQRRLQAQQRDRLDDILHQFRNPLTALRTFGKLLLNRLQPDDKNHNVAASIVRESDRLKELLQDFDECLDENAQTSEPLTLPASASAATCPLSESDENGKIVAPVNSESDTDASAIPLLPGKPLIVESFTITEVLEPLLISAQAIAGERDLELRYSIPQDLPPVRANARALREVLNNLIDNALKYTPAGGQIDVEAGVGQPKDEARTMVGIAITDTGVGIPPQDIEHLFERRYRGIQANTGIPGSGLGLAIAKTLIEQMQGQIEVFSPAQSPWIQSQSDPAIQRSGEESMKGTTFVVWLPTNES